MGKGRRIVKAVDTGAAAAFFKRDTTDLERALKIAQDTNSESAWNRYYVKLMHSRGVCISMLESLNAAVARLKRQIKKGEPPEVNPFAGLPLVAALSVQLYRIVDDRDGGDTYERIPFDRDALSLRTRLVDGLRGVLRGMVKLCSGGAGSWMSEAGAKLFIRLRLKLERAWEPECESYNARKIEKLPGLLETAFEKAREDYELHCDVDENQVPRLSSYMRKVLIAYIPNTVLEFRDGGRFETKRRAKKVWRVLDVLVRSTAKDGWVARKDLEAAIGGEFHEGSIGGGGSVKSLRAYIERNRERFRIVGKARAIRKYYREK